MRQKPAGRKSKQHAIHAVIMRTPGIHMSEVQRELGLGWGTVAYHVQVLQSNGRIAVHRGGREARLFAAGVSHERMAWISATHNPVHASILEALGRTPGLRADDLAAGLALTPNAVRRHLSALGRQGLVGWKGVHGRRFFVRAPQFTAIGPFLAHASAEAPPAAAAAASPSRRYNGEGSRERILATIQAAPGIHTGELTRATSVSWGNLAHHLRVLEGEGLVLRKRFGSRTCYFLPAVPEADRALQVARRQEVTSLILDALGSRPGAMVGDLASATGARPSAVSRHLHHLIEEGLVRSVDPAGQRFEVAGGLGAPGAGWPLSA